jgi:hypothetical protein
MANAVCWAQAVVALAGPAAEQKFAGYPPATLAIMRGSAWATDYRNAEHWLSRIRSVSPSRADGNAFAQHMWGATPCIKCRAP